MSLKEYHNNLSRWFREQIIVLTKDIEISELWTRYPHINSPGWTLMHLIAEGELALKKIKQDYVSRVEIPELFMVGSDGNARSDYSIDEMHNLLNDVYRTLEQEVESRLGYLNEIEIDDEYLKDVLKTELDFYLHMLTTHIAMHCDATVKWRLNAGMKAFV
jgi:hypothetical protein